MFLARLLPVLLIALPLFAQSARKCITSQIIKPKEQIQLKQSQTTCSPDAYYDSVFIKTTPHFAIIYTKTGPHATNETFLDSLEKSLEIAYTRYTKTHKTLPPLGLKSSWHYRQEVPNNLYPIEILELDLLRGLQSLTGENNCQYCMALTIPSFNGDGSSTILIDNDFKHASQSSATSSFSKDSSSCPYSVSDFEIQNNTHHYAYADKFGAGIRVTIYHELYHAIQLRYLNLMQYSTYWFEASASGMEEVTAPDIDDYISFTDHLSNMRWQSFNEISNAYAFAPYFINLYKNFGPTFDTEIWEQFKRNPTGPLEQQINSLLSPKGIDSDSLFHLFAKEYYFSGVNASKAPPKIKPHEDAALWATPNTLSANSTYSTSFPYFTYRYESAYPEAPGQKTYLLKNKEDSLYSLLPIGSYKEYLNQYAKIQNADTVVLVLSRFLQANPDSTKQQSKPLLAYPNPYRGNHPLCFTGLSENGGTLEIRNQRGSLVLSQKYNTSNFCFQQNEVKQHFAPGLYFYRNGKKEKPKKLILLKP